MSDDERHVGSRSIILDDLDAAADLSPLERVITEPLCRIDPRLVDGTRSSVVHREDFVRVRLSAVDDRCCPFEFHFGRGESLGHFNFFVGPGIGFVVYEEIGDANGAGLLADDVTGFIESEIRGEEYVSQGGRVEGANYTASRMFIDASPVRLGFGGRGPFWRRYRVRRVAYEAWVSRE